MSEKWLQFYRTSLDLNRMATFDWDVVADTLEYDEMMTHLLQIDVPTSNVKENLLLAKMIHPKDRQEFQNHVDRILHMKSQRRDPLQDKILDFRVYVKGAGFIWMHLAYRIRYENGDAKQVTGFLQNIDLERQEQAKMQRMVEHDPMTGLFTKTHTAYLVTQEISVPESVHALLVIDLDNFKSVNDKLGHLIGDAVIVDMALNLKMVFRPTDILGHIGGDEFCVLMKNIPDHEIVIKKCTQLRDLLRKTYTYEGGEVTVSSSIGIAISPEHGAEYKELFTHADAALYEVKRRGKDSQVIYSPEFEGNNDKAEKKVEEKEESGAKDFQSLLNNPMDYIFQLTLKSQDTSIAVRLLLEIFAKQFKVNRAYVFWHLDGPYWPQPLFDCVVGQGNTAAATHDAYVRRQMRKRYKNTELGRFTECGDTEKLPTKAREIFSKRHIRAFLECAIMDGDIFLGCVGFDDCIKAREWTRSEHEVLRAFADIMQRFLFGQIFFERQKKSGGWNV